MDATLFTAAGQHDGGTPYRHAGLDRPVARPACGRLAAE